MNELVRRTIVYVLFIALGVFFAEVISSNVTLALASPVAYLIYGLVYVHFIDLLLRYKVKHYANIYVFGVLVGLITETYVAKVMIYGISSGETLFFGFPLFAVIFLGLFYHAFYSFFLPIYFAKRFLGFPFSFKTHWLLDTAVFLAPVIILPSVVSDKTGSLKFIVPALISIVILIGWSLLIRYGSSTVNLIFSKGERISWIIISMGIYVYFLATFINPAHNPIQPLDFPPLQMITITLIIVAIFALNYLSIRKNSPQRQAIFNADNVNIKALLALLGVYLMSLLIPFIFFPSFLPFIAGLRPLLGITAAMAGISTFVLSFIFVISRILRKY